MRTFEWVLFGVIAAAVFLPVMLSTRLKRGRMSVLLIAALVAQLAIEGIRWQLWPMYLSAVGLAVGDLLWEERRVRGWPRFRRAMLGIPGCMAVVVLPVVLPVPTMPPTTGPFPVGTTSVVVVDPDRIERFGQTDPDDASEDEEGVVIETAPRRLMVQVWYPGFEDPEAAAAPWNPDWDVVGPALAQHLGFPGFFLGHVAEVPANARPGLQILTGRLPVVLYSHGWGGFRTIALNQIESLASHGYVVIAVDHSFASIATRFPDGEVVRLDPRALPDVESEGVDQDDFDEAAEELVETMADDLALIVEELTAGADGVFSSIAEHVDLESLGAFGHSAGGGAAVRFCIEDERCEAVYGADPWVTPIPDRVVAKELSQPSLFIRSDEWIDTANDRRLRGLAERSTEVSYWVSVEGALHNDFVMTPLLSPYADRLGLKGPIPAQRIVRILDDYLVAFFDRYLYGIGGAVLDGRPPPEVDAERLP